MGPKAGDWLLSMLGKVDEAASRQRHLLHLLAQKHLQGQSLLLGNPVPLPLLGRTVLFKVVPRICHQAR